MNAFNYSMILTMLLLATLVRGSIPETSFTLFVKTDFEDKPVVESIYSSAVSGHGKAGPLHVQHEETIYHFIRYLSKKLGD